jgi:hypothetical protein
MTQQQPKPIVGARCKRQATGRGEIGRRPILRQFGDNSGKRGRFQWPSWNGRFTVGPAWRSLTSGARLLVPGGILLLTDHFAFTLDPGSRWSAEIHRCFRSTVDLIPLHESRRPFYLVSVLEKARS